MMKQCPHCGTLMSDTDTFCPACGKSPHAGETPAEPPRPSHTAEDEEVERLLREFKEEERRHEEFAAQHSVGATAADSSRRAARAEAEPRRQAAPRETASPRREEPRRAEKAPRKSAKSGFSALFSPSEKPRREEHVPAAGREEPEDFNPHKTPRALPWLVFGLVCIALAVWVLGRMFFSMDNIPQKTDETQQEGTAQAGDQTAAAAPEVEGPYAADYLGKTVDEIQKTLGEGAIVPEEGWNGSRYFYYEGSPFAFYFNPEKWDTVTGKEQVISIDISKGGSVREKLASNFTLSQIKKAAGTEVTLHVPSSPEDTQEWYVELNYDAYAVLFTWDQSDMEQPAQFATVRMKQE